MSVVSIVAVAAVVLLLVATLGVSLIIYPVVWWTVRDSWRRIPVERRPRALGAGAMVLAFSGVIAALLFIEPWGSHTIVWVMLVFAGSLACWGFGMALVQGVRASRRARRGRDA